MSRLGCIVAGVVVLTSCGSRIFFPQWMAAPSVDVIEVSITVSGPGRYGAGLEVFPSGKVSGSDVDGTPDPFVHMYEKTLNEEQTKRIFDLAKAVLRRDAGKEPIIDRNDIVYIVIRTSDGKWHTYFRDRTGVFPLDELNELDRTLKAIEQWPTIHWP